MSRLSTWLGLDPAVTETALDALELTEDQFWTLDADSFAAVLEVRYLRPLQEWIARDQARTDQLDAGRRQMGADPVPPGMPLYGAAEAGIIDMDAFGDATQTLVRVQAEDEADPSPHSDAVTALLGALAANLSDGGAAR